MTRKQEEKIEEMRRMGAEVVYQRVDVRERESVQGGVEWLEREWGGMDGIVQSVGVRRDGYMGRQSREERGEVLGGKVRGLELVDEESRHWKLEFVVVFGSLAGVVGNVGQGVYGAANGYVDEYVRVRNERVERGERRGRTVAVDWGSSRLR